MTDRQKNAASAVAAALRASVTGREATGQLDHYQSPRSPRKRLIVKAIGPEGQPFEENGQVAKVLLSLVKAGEDGITPLARETWSLRLSDHVRKLKNRRSLTIVTLWGKHDDGRHARYVLRSTLKIIEVISD
jgi:hypothetical protein